MKVNKKLKIKFSKFKPIKKPFIYEDEKYLKVQRALIVWGLPILVTFLTYHFFTHPYLPLKSVMWGSALGLGSYCLMVSMIKAGTQRFWIIFISIVSFSTLNIFIDLGEILENLPIIGKHGDFVYPFIFMGLPLYFVLKKIYKDWYSIKHQKLRLKKPTIKNFKIIKIKKRASRQIISNDFSDVIY